MVFAPGADAAARSVLRAALEPIPLPGFSDSTALTSANIVLAASPAEFHAAAGGSVPDWAAAVALPSRRTIVLPGFGGATGPRGDLRVVLRHEIAHLSLAERLPPNVPRWFTEGYATWVSGEWDQGSSWQIRLAFLLNRAPPLDSLALRWPRHAGEARLAYLLSASAVRHLATRNGPHAFEALLSAWRREGTLDAALRRVYGVTMGQFEAEWVKLVRRRYGWLLALSQVTVFWGLLTVLLLVLSWPRFRRKQAQMERLEWEDRIFPPPPGWDAPSEAWDEPEPEAGLGAPAPPHAAEAAAPEPGLDRRSVHLPPHLDDGNRNA